MRVRVYTDGACSGNPGPGGWAALIMAPLGYRTTCGFDTNTTNNRMELTAVIEGLKFVLSHTYSSDAQVNNVDVYSDSAYVVNAINNEWTKRWELNHWKTKADKDVKNRDLWEELQSTIGDVRLLNEHGCKVNFVKVKGHAGNTFNEMVDKLAVEESMKAQTGLRQQR